MTTTTLDAELEAVVSDAQQRRREAIRVLRRLWPDRDDSLVLAEITSTLGALRQAEAALKDAER